MADIEAMSKPNRPPPMTATAVMTYILPTTYILAAILGSQNG
jgi:hypothetical protein